MDLRPSVLIRFPGASPSRQVAVQRPAVSFVFRGPSCPSSSWSRLRLCCLLSRVQLPQQVVALSSAVLICFPGASFPSQVAILSWSGRGRAWLGSVGWGPSFTGSASASGPNLQVLKINDFLTLSVFQKCLLGAKSFCAQHFTELQRKLSHTSALAQQSPKI